MQKDPIDPTSGACLVPVLTPVEEEFLSTISTSGQFTLEQALELYRGIEPVTGPGKPAASMLNTLAHISNPKNAHLFSAEAARKAFGAVPVRGKPAS